jgi:hypothetical protein
MQSALTPCFGRAVDFARSTDRFPVGSKLNRALRRQPLVDGAMDGRNAQIAVMARRKGELGVTLIIDHNGSKLGRARRSR